ncbi:hypothetical protein [Mycobacteroides abscessus]|uniref:hypothetical protein n=1 Tax=Mycobacteroides abscessus TaxID=36809 RepID=UPI001C65F36E|nr:hypothetical protein [Mycobacteroides abscessus]MDM2082835.1 hypothetical protein [Mycobacteroides abscessus]MDM2086009.1 hypothetical protein [Mycobacteroides abscessus]
MGRSPAAALPNNFWDVWFPRSVSRAIVIAPAADDDLSDAALTARNYSRFDSLGDRDSVYALGVFLARRYPKIDITLMSSLDFDSIPLSENLIIVGGPGEYVPADCRWKFGNQVCREFNKRVPSRFSYSDDCESLRAGGAEYAAVVDEGDRMTRDFGVFRRFVNPFNAESAIVMVHGIHTLGVLGATKVFDGSGKSASNFALIDTRATSAGSKYEFECFFDVDILNGNVATPILASERLYSIGPHSAQSLTGHVPVTGATAIGASVASLRTEVVHSIRAACNNVTRWRRTEIERVLERVNAATLNEDQCCRIIEICKSNDRLPPEALQEIISVLC